MEPRPLCRPTAAEASAVAALFPHGVALVGPQARASELVRLAPQAQVLHLAAHSGLSQELNQTYIELSDGRFSLEQVYGLQLERGAPGGAQLLREWPGPGGTGSRGFQSGQRLPILRRLQRGGHSLAGGRRTLGGLLSEVLSSPAQKPEYLDFAASGSAGLPGRSAAEFAAQLGYELIGDPG